MAKDFSQLKKGSLELVILFLLTQKDMYVYEVIEEISNRSKGLFPMQKGSLYPVFYRLIKMGAITSRNEIFNGRNRVYYHLEKEGQELLNELKVEYDSISKGIQNIFDSDTTEVTK